MLPFGALEAPRFFCAGRSAPQLRREVAQCRRTAFTWARETPKCRATTSIGVAYSTQPCAAGELLSRADAALYEAKGAGRDTFRVRNRASSAGKQEAPREDSGQDTVHQRIRAT